MCDADGRMRAEGEKMHGGEMALVLWPDAAYGDLSKEGSCRIGYIVGLMPSSPSGPRNILQGDTKFIRELVESSLGSGVYASRELVDHMAPLRKLRPPVADIPSGMGGMGDCESFFGRLEKKKTVAEEYRNRHFLGFQQVLGRGGLDNAYWLSGVGKPREWNGESQE